MMSYRSNWDHLWTSLSKDRLLGWVSTLNQAEAVREAYEVDKATFFVSRCKAAHFGEHNNCIQNKFRIRYKDLKDAVVPYDGVPFIIQSRYERDCMFGKDKHKSTKDRLLASREQQLKNNEPVPKRSRRVQNWSRKQGCPAKIIMKEVIRFPSFKLKTNTEFVRRMTSEKLRKALESGKQLVEEHRVYVRFPKDDDHDEAHRAGLSTGCMHPLNEDIRSKITDLTVEGVTNVKAVMRQLRVFVQTELFKDQPMPAKSDLAFYPMYGTIRKHMQMARRRQTMNMTMAGDAFSTHQRPRHINQIGTRLFLPSSRLPAPPLLTTTNELDPNATDIVDGVGLTEDGGQLSLSVKDLASVCRTKLASIRRSTYQCRDPGVLHQLVTLLDHADDYVNWNLSTEQQLAPDDDDNDNAEDFACDAESSAPRRRRRLSRPAVKRRKLAAGMADVRDSAETVAEFSVPVGKNVQQLIDQSQAVTFELSDNVELPGRGGDRLTGDDETRPIIHLLFVDRDSGVIDDQYTELTNEQLANLVSASLQQQGIGVTT